MRRGRLICAQLLVFAFTLGAFAVNATACEGGGGGGGELTSLSTKLSGGGKEGEEITVSEGTKVKDKATLTGKKASTATGKVTYKVYSEKNCATLVTSAGEVTVSGESVPASNEEELEAGKAYYWQAHYGGDTNNAESTSPCTEILDVQAKTSLSTKLSGEGKEAEELTINEGSKAKDTAKLSGTNSSSAGGKVLYKIYSDKECKTLVKEAGEVTVSSGSIPASSEEELKGGTYYWQATYKGDGLHQESTSKCGKAVENVIKCTNPYCEPTITPGVKLKIDKEGKFCTAGPMMTKGTERFVLTAGHCFEENLATITQKVLSAYPEEVAGGTEKEVGKTVDLHFTHYYDSAEVKIENTAWSLAPVLVEWEAAPKVTSVVGKAANKVGELTCFTAAISDTVRCGLVLRTGATKLGDDPVLGLVETTTPDTAGGDSGAPEFIRTPSGVLIQGTYVGSGEFWRTRNADVTNNSDQITSFPSGEEGNTACDVITAMKACGPPCRSRERVFPRKRP